MKPEELKPMDLLCDMGLDVNGQRHYQPWKAYDIDEVNLVINELELALSNSRDHEKFLRNCFDNHRRRIEELEAENERLKVELKQTEAQYQVITFNTDANVNEFLAKNHVQVESITPVPMGQLGIVWAVVYKQKVTGRR